MTTQATGVRFTATGQAVAAATLTAGLGVVGVSALNATASLNHVVIYEGTDTTGRVLGALTLAVSSAGSIEFSVPRMAKTGVYITCTGDVVGTLWYV